MSSNSKEQETTVDLSGILNDATSLVNGEIITTIDNHENNKSVTTAALIIDCHNELGECILYDDEQSTIVWTDILKKQLHRLHLNYEQPTSSQWSTYNLPKQLCSFGLLTSTKQKSRMDSKSREENGSSNEEKDSLPLMCAWEDGFQLYDVTRGQALSEYSIGETVNPTDVNARLNDGRVDPTGRRFVCGGLVSRTNPTNGRAKVYKVEQHVESTDPCRRLHHEPILEDIQVANSICWSLDHLTMYFADSRTKQIQQYLYNADKGRVSDKKILVNETNYLLRGDIPDGSITDCEGFLWNAVFRHGEGPGRIQRIHPISGKIVYTVHMPDTTSQVTCCCFGGENLDILFITSASVNMDPRKEPHAGGIYAAKVPFLGCKESRLHFTW